MGVFTATVMRHTSALAMPAQAVQTRRRRQDTQNYGMENSKTNRYNVGILLVKNGVRAD
ncbi:MAG: hypothetical protein WDA11_07185 [Thiohalomonadaceae bacterium]